MIPSFIYQSVESEAPETASWEEFESRYPTDDSCLQELLSRLGISKQCRHCGSLNLKEKVRFRNVTCENCHKDTWLTAGTFIDRIRKPRAWWAAIWLLERRIMINAFRLHKLINIAYSTAFKIFKKVMMLFDAQIPEGTATIESERFASLYCRRSRETPAGEHPVAEQAEAEAKQSRARSGNLSAADEVTNNVQEHADRSTDKAPANTNSNIQKCRGVSGLDERQQIVYDALSDMPMHFDMLCHHTEFAAAEMSSVLTMLELFGLARNEPGQRFVRVRVTQSPARTESSDSTIAAVSETIAFLKSLFGGISRKYLQHYLALYWYFNDRERWTPETFYDTFASSHAFCFPDIRHYVSPPMVAVLPVAGTFAND